MSIRLSIPKLSAAGVAPLQVAPRFTSDLLRSGLTWPQDVNYLRDIYMEVFSIWESYDKSTHVIDEEGNKSVSDPGYAPEDDKRLFDETEPKLRELLLGLDDVSQQVSNRPDVARMVENARHDFNIAGSHAKGEDYAMATMYLSYSLTRLHRVLDGLTALANKRKTAHGYDISGEVFEPGEMESRSPNLWDQGNSPKMDRTTNNPANRMVDAEAESDYPELKEFKHKRVHWPARVR